MHKLYYSRSSLGRHCAFKKHRYFCAARTNRKSTKLAMLFDVFRLWSQGFVSYTFSLSTSGGKAYTCLQFIYAKHTPQINIKNRDLTENVVPNGLS